MHRWGGEEKEAIPPGDARVERNSEVPEKHGSPHPEDAVRSAGKIGPSHLSRALRSGAGTRVSFRVAFLSCARETVTEETLPSAPPVTAAENL